MKNKLFKTLISILFSISIYYLFNKSNIISLLSILFGFISFEIIKKYKFKKLPYIFSFIGVFIYLLGYSLYYHMSIGYFFKDINHIMILLCSFISLTIIMGNYLFYIFETIKKTNIFDRENGKFKFIPVWLSILVVWLPAYIAYYPGIYAYDIRMQYIELHNVLTKYHPPLHTFIWGFCEFIGKLIHIRALTVYSTLQMILISLVTTYIIKFIHDLKVKRPIKIISYIFLVVNPLMPIFSLITAKDVYFAMCFTMVITLLYDFTNNEEEFLNTSKKYIQLYIFIVLSCLFRNNAVYAFIVLIPVLLIVYRKYLKRMIIVFVLPLIVFYIINNPFYHALGILDGNKREMLSVPLQQISYVVKYHNDEISGFTKNNLKKYITEDDIKKYFNIRFADPIKNCFSTHNYYLDKKSFYSIWFNLFKRYPKDYVNVFLELNIPYWFVDADSIDKYAGRPYLEDGAFIDNEPQRYEILPGSLSFVKMPPCKWEKAYNFYHNFASYKYVSKMPIVKTLLSLSFPFVLMVFTSFSLIYKRLYNKLLVVLLPFMYLMTFLLGPVSNLRYIYPFMMIYPIFLVLIFENKR